MSSDEKNETNLEHSLRTASTTVDDDGRESTSKDEASSIDGDDALKLVGAHAHHFDEQYYRRLRRKIVCSTLVSDHCCRQLLTERQDLHIMPILLFIYFTQFLDKNILSYASIMGFPVEGIW